MDQVILSTATFSDFRHQLDVAWELFCQLSDEDKVPAADLWNTFAVKIQSNIVTITNVRRQPTGNTAEDEGSATVPGASSGQAAYDVHVQEQVLGVGNSFQDSKGCTQGQAAAAEDEDVVIDKVLDDVIRLEIETEFLSEIKPNNHDLAEAPSLDQQYSTIAAQPQEKKSDIVAPVQHQPNKIWQCSSCSSVFDTEKAQKLHMKENHKNKAFKCDQCPASFSTRGNLNVHLRSNSHNGERKFECTKCTSRFATSSNLRRHVLSHQGLKPYRCSVCHSCFTEKRSLIIHSRIHSGERPYSCPHCPKTFAQNTVLQNHIRVHTDEKKFPCPSCPKSFKQKAHLIRHTSYIHKGAGAKTKVCPECNWQFVTKGDLNRHLKSKSHAGEKRFLCSQCGKRFMRQANLTEHINATHSKSQHSKC